MAIFTYQNIKDRFNQFIKTNFLQLITGALLNGILHDIVDSVKSWMNDYVLKSDLRDGSMNVTDEGVDIIFNPPYPEGTQYRIVRNCQDENGDVGYRITNRTVNGFTVTSDFPAVFEFNTKKI